MTKYAGCLNCSCKNRVPSAYETIEDAAITYICNRLGNLYAIRGVNLKLIGTVLFLTECISVIVGVLINIGIPGCEI